MPYQVGHSIDRCVMKLDKAGILKRIDAIVCDWDQLETAFRRGNSDHVSEARQLQVATAIAEAIRQYAPRGSVYRQHLAGVSAIIPTGDGLEIHLNLIGVLRALRQAYEDGYLDTVAELIRADTFSDLLEQADYLLSEGYKDAAAVMIGGVLEEHLRRFSAKNNLPVTDANDKPLTGGALNDSLAKADVYGKLEQKTVTAWLDLRNKAAHAKYSEYDKRQVEYLLLGVRDFLGRFSA